MSKIKLADFYYGAVLSMLFNRKVNPALVESDDKRQIYNIATNNGEYLLYIKYRSDKSNLKTQDYNSWQFVLSDGEVEEIKEIINSDKNFQMVLVCGLKNLSKSEVAVIGKDEISKIFDLDKSSFTISRKKNGRVYRVFIDGSRATAMQVRSNTFDNIC